MAGGGARHRSGTAPCTEEARDEASGNFRPAVLLVAALLGGLVWSGEATHGGAATMQPRAFEVMEATIPELQAALTAGTVTSRQLVARYLARIEAYDRQGPALNAVSVVNRNALAEAEALDAERRARGPRGPLHGIPVIVKDNYDTADMQTAAGSILMKDWLPPDDAFVVRRLREAGAIIIAKSNMHEWAYGITTVGSLFGQTRNPYAPGRNPGGSSGGTGAAIAASFAAVGLGSDTCGSIRLPAAHNSLVGIRATQGLASRGGIVPLAHSQDIGGPIGRTVTDVAILLDAIVGYDPDDPQTAESVGRIPRSYTEFLQLTGLRGARIGILTDLFGTDPADAEVAGIVRAALDEMRALGAEVVEVSIPNLSPLLVGAGVIREEFRADLAAYLAARPTAPIKTLKEVVDSGQFHPMVRDVLVAAQNVDELDPKDYLEKLVRRGAIRQTALAAMADHNLDALAYPPIRRKAAPLGEAQPGNNCVLSATSGLPAIVVPAGFTEDGLPVGVELLGRAWGEGQLIRLAYAYEQGTRHRRPPTSTPPLGGP
jgi:amidase